MPVYLSFMILPNICLGSKSAGEENWSGERPTLTKSSYCSSATYTTATSDEDVTHYHAYTQTTSDSGDTLSRAMSQRWEFAEVDSILSIEMMTCFDFNQI